MGRRVKMEDVQKYIAKAQRLAPTVVDEVKSMNPSRDVLLLLVTAYFGVLNVIALIMPSLFVAFMAAIVSRWKADATETKEVLFGLTAFAGLNCVANLFIVMYGSLSVITFVNAAVSGGLAFLLAKESGVIGGAPAAPKPASE